MTDHPLAKKKKQLEEALRMLIEKFGKDHPAVRVVEVELDLINHVIKLSR